MISKIVATQAITLAVGSALAVWAQTPAEKIDFEKQVLPILKDSCFKCHEKESTDPATGKVKKPKGKLRVDNAEAILKGGSEGNTVVTGDASKSSLYTTTTLPETDEMAMPPEGKGDRLTKEQQEIIKNWINQGANFGSWKGVE